MNSISLAFSSICVIVGRAREPVCCGSTGGAVPSNRVALFNSPEKLWTSRDVIFITLLAFIYGSLTIGLSIVWGDSSTEISRAILLACVTSLIVETYRRTQRQFVSVREDIDQAHRQLEAFFSLTACLKLAAPLPRMQGWPITPEVANVLITLVQDRKPRRIVEIGSGVSTLILGYAQRQYSSGTVISLEHDSDFAEKTRASIRRHGLCDVATLLDAPLRPIEIMGRSWMWYGIPDQERLGPIDLLVIDGPPADSVPDVRYPAVPLLLPFLAPDAIVVVDDCIRRGEQEIVARWLNEIGGFTREYVDTQKGTIVLRRVCKP